ncbi:hypothetical protein RAS1_42280 [Phycisphaerae bacterium RAS1]|nr:hypothetical protein RAS1_42280 [Phycisphaerae bacterium RAS1]
MLKEHVSVEGSVCTLQLWDEAPGGAQTPLCTVAIDVGASRAALDNKGETFSQAAQRVYHYLFNPVVPTRPVPIG